MIFKNKKSQYYSDLLTYTHYGLKQSGLFAGSLESANWSIVAPLEVFKEMVGKKSGFYVN